MDRDEYDDILNALYEVRQTIAEWRADDVFDGDRGFQRLLEKESDLEERLNEKFN
jgi:hypothetical protein